MASNKKVIIVGAGISGLNCARILQANNHEVVILEESSRVGGRVATDMVDGFRLDHGFQVINPAYSELQATGLVEQLEIAALPKGVELVLDKLYIVGDPRRSWQYLSGDLSGKTGDWLEKAKFLKSLLAVKSDQRFGVAFESSGSFYAQVIKPFMTGVFLTNPDEVSAAMARELIGWFIKGNPGLAKQGVKALPELLARDLKIKLNTKVTGINPGSVTVGVTEIKADVVVLATNQRSAAQLLGRGNWSMNSSTTWYYSLPEGAIISKHLRIDPKSPLINSVVLSNIAPSYAPQGKSLVSTTALDNLPDELVRQELARIWQLSAKEFEFIKRYEIPESLPKHLPGKPLLSDLRIDAGLYAIGDYKAVPSQQGALMTGRLAAEAIMAD